MNMRTVNDRTGGRVPLVDKMLGNAYDTVRAVAENLPYVKHVSSQLENVFNVSQKLVEIATVSGSIASVNALVQIQAQIVSLALHTTQIDTVATNISDVIDISDHMTELLDIQVKIDRVYQDLDALEATLDVANSFANGPVDGTVETENGPMPTLAGLVQEFQVAASGRKGYATKALMDADLLPNANFIAEVTNDPNYAFNQQYIKLGASGMGSWLPTVDRLQIALGNAVGFQQRSSAFTRAYQNKAQERVSVLDFIDPTLHDSIRTRTSNVDVRAGIQAALNASLHVVIPDGLYPVSLGGVDMSSGQVLEFEGSATLKQLAHNATNYEMIRVWDKTSVVIINPHLDGSRELNTAVTGEWGMGISICGSSKVRVTGGEIIGCWGDGLYIAGTNFAGLSYSSKIRIESNYVYNCRRQGMSVISVKGLRVAGFIADTINGTAPQCGIDLEPNDNTNFLEDIVLDNVFSLNCAGGGIAVSIQVLVGATAKNVDITINNHIDDGSLCATKFYGFNPATGSITGQVNYNNPVWKRSGMSAVNCRVWPYVGPQIRIRNPVIIDPNTSAGASGRYNGVISCYGDTTDTGTWSIGGLHVEGATIQMPNTTAPLLQLVQDVRTAASMPRNISWIDPKEISGNAVTINSLWANIANTWIWSDKFNKQQQPLAGSLSFSGANHYNYVMTASGTISLPATYTLGMPDLTISIQAGTTTITPPAGGKILGFGADAAIRCTQIGGSIKLRPLGGNTYSIIEQSGDWAIAGAAVPLRDMAGTSAPTSGAWTQGNKVWNNNAAAGGFAGWVCVASGTPGTWKTFGPITA